IYRIESFCDLFEYGPVRLRVRQIGGVDDRVDERREAVRREVGVVPIRCPPGVRQKPEPVATRTQERERGDGVGINGRPSRDRLRITVHGTEELRAADRDTETVEALADEAGRRP